MDGDVTSRRDATPSPESIARANRRRLASEDGARAMIDIEQRAVAVRKNMERLRAVREARDAQEHGAPGGILMKPARKPAKPGSKYGPGSK